MAPPRENYPTTQEKLQTLSSKEGLSVLSDLKQTELKASTSRWTLRHILAYRLIVQPKKPFLEPLKPDHKSCSYCKNKGPQNLDRDMVGKLLEDVPKSVLLGTERELLKRPGGFFWVSLAQASHLSDSPAPKGPDNAPSPPDSAPSAPVKRKSQEVTRPEFRNTLEEISPGPDSPFLRSTSPQSDTSYVNKDTIEAHRSIPEVISVNLAVDFIRYVLQLCLIQEDDEKEVRARPHPRRGQATIAGHDITFEDDAGISLHLKRPGMWTTENPFMALVEVKRAQNIYVEEGKRRTAIMPSATMAQCLGEAVLA
ncbi:hypothetical protein QQS21_012845 [Conoideocrella luteorostrata]|uniref:Uncharacterized protein n=1 Tax=Conoideocrella luteorostrata TaxID=1105319 RepID=A0AAJ0CAF2_9HYPO|nr:hypothetical protein QQS21_012845 [Conoideocrella luteorostrata]